MIDSKEHFRERPYCTVVCKYICLRVHYDVFNVPNIVTSHYHLEHHAMNYGSRYHKPSILCALIEDTDRGVILAKS